MKQDKGTDKDKTLKLPHTNHDSVMKPVITVDYERYAHFLDSSDLSDEQKQEFLQTLWNIVVGFVDLGFGVHPVQQAQKPCGKVEVSEPKPALTVPNRVECSLKSLIHRFASSVDQKSDVKEGSIE